MGGYGRPFCHLLVGGFLPATGFSPWPDRLKRSNIAPEERHRAIGGSFSRLEGTPETRCGIRPCKPLLRRTIGLLLVHLLS